jgi:chemotaxis protein MotA
MIAPFDIEMAPLLRLIDPFALALVCVGSLVIAALHGTWGDVATAFRALGSLRRRFDLADHRVEILRLERLARRHGFLAIENEQIGDASLDRAVAGVVDGVPIERLRASLARERQERRRRHAIAPAFWCTVADAAPAMGMIGTIIGLVGMFARLDDVAKVGPSMALALLTTLYGAILANLIAAPIAGRLTRLAAIEDEARAVLEDDIVALAAAEMPSARSSRRRVA